MKEKMGQKGASLLTKVLKTIKELNDLEHQSKECISDVILKGKIVASLESLEEYEINEALISLSKKELIVDIFHKENKYIYGASITDAGLCLLKHYRKLWFKNACKIVGGYIWQIIIVIITVILTKYFGI